MFEPQSDPDTDEFVVHKNSQLAECNTSVTSVTLFVSVSLRLAVADTAYNNINTIMMLQCVLILIANQVCPGTGSLAVVV